MSDNARVVTKLQNRRSFLGGMGLATVGVGSAAFLAACTTNSTNSPASSQSGGSKLGEVLARKKVIVGTGTGNPPWHFDDGHGNLIGMDISMGMLLANGLFGDPKAVEFVQETPASRIPNLVTNKVDVVFQYMTVTALRSQTCEFSIPYYREGNSFLILKTSRYQTLDAMLAAGSNCTVSILMNPDSVTSIHTILPSATVLQLDTTPNSVLALESGKADAVFFDDSSLRYLIATTPGKYNRVGFSFQVGNYSAAVRPGDQIWLNYIDTVIYLGLTGSDFGAYAAAFKTYFGVALTAPTPGFPLDFQASGAVNGTSS